MNGKEVKIAVCDDLPDERQNVINCVKEYADEYGQKVSVDEYGSGEELLASGETYQLVFLDIFMGEINGMETAKKLCFENPHVSVVFATTSKDFAIEAFDVKALHYFLKPVGKEKMFGILEEFFYRYDLSRTVTVKTGRTVKEIFLSDILYVEAVKHSSVVHTKSEDIKASMTLAEWEQTLPKDFFVKPIRWALAAVSEITSLPTDSVTLSDGTKIPVSRGNREAVLKGISDYRFRKMTRGLRG